MIATTAVTVTVGKKTAIAGGKETTFPFSLSHSFFLSSLLLTCSVLSLSKLYFSLPRRLLPACLKHLVSLHSWLFLSSLRLSFSAISHYKIGLFFDWIC